MDKYLVVTSTLQDDLVSFHETIDTALRECGVNQWEMAMPRLAVRKLNPGDQININPKAFIVVLSGVETTHVG